MEELLIVVLIIVALADSITGRYPNCVNCTNGSIPLSPLSYNIIRSHVFSGTQPSNGGCTNGPSVDGQATVDCGLGTALVDCNLDMNQEMFSNLSNTPIFIWNKTALSSNEVSIVFKFDQQINIAVIRMYFWSSISNNVAVPNVKIYWSDEDDVMPSNKFVITHSTSGFDPGQQILTICISNHQKFRYLRIKMSLANSYQWMVLSEVEFCGTTAPYHITQPTANQNVRIISSTVRTANVTFSLNVTISHNIMITWLYNGSDIAQLPRYNIVQAGNTATLLIEDPQPSDAGVYQCVAGDTVNGWTLRRVIILVIQSNCAQLSSLANGQIVPCNSNAARVHYETCQSNGNWSGSENTCKRVDCHLLPNGVVNCTSDTTVTAITPAEEDTCTFCCNAGHYALQGSTNRICISEADPFCITAEIIDNGHNETTVDGSPNDIATENVSHDNGTDTNNTINGNDTDTNNTISGNDTDTNNTISGNGTETGNASSGNVNPDDIRCEYYNLTGICKDYLLEFDHPVKFALNTNHSFSDVETAVYVFVNVLRDNADVIHGHCYETLLRFVCRWVYFPTCDPACNVSVSQHICRRSCEILTIFECPEAWGLYQQFRSILNVPQGDNNDTCNNLMYANGGDVPDCTDPLDGDKIPGFSVTTDCFDGRGRGYNGAINITRSGKTCQHWSVQAPHQFILPSSQYPEIAGDHNYCRNPGSRGPEGPWCFTTDPNTRWEYCDVPQCDPSTSCELYHSGPNATAVCFGFGLIGRDYVFVNNSVDTMDDLNLQLSKFNNMLYVSDRNFTPDCIESVLRLMCHRSFPLCDHGSDTPVPRQMCRSYCEEVSTMKCRELWEYLQNSSDVAEIIELPDCKTLPSSEGGDHLECYIPCNNGRGRHDDDNSTNCYTDDDLGIFYNGTINVTVSGRTCQYWDSEIPHFHPITSKYRPYLEGHNYCRNPEGRGRHPWCYTMDPTTRWEYCNIPVCPQDHNNNNSLLTVVTIAAPILVLILLVLVIVLFSVCIWTIKKKKEPVVSLYVSHNNDIDNTSACDNEYVMGPMVTASEKLPNYPRENFTYLCDLGQGNYGTVIKGEAKDIIPDQSSTLVAAKVLKEGASSDARSNFIYEAEIVNQFDHPNILKLLGVCFDSEPFFIIFEYMDLGDLNGYLRNAANGDGPSSSNLTMQRLVDMAINIAAGLEYLAVHHFVHRDLATRNCLINEKFVVKIADFGLSKDVYSKDYYRMDNKSVLPIRWMPPEAILYCKFSTHSDIWSFGIVLWEIFSRGTQPYYAYSNEEVVDYVTKKNVLRCPNGCPSELYDLMVKCWTSNPKKRPTASEVHAQLQRWNSSNAGSPKVMEQGEDFDTASPNQLILETTV